MDMTILLFEGMTALDAIGPFDVFREIPDVKVTFVAEEPGAKHTDDGSLGLVASHAITDVDRTDVLMIPGGFGVERVVEQPKTLEWIRAIHETTTYTTSVCTGSIVLGAAGLLKGLAATTHWSMYDWLASYGALPTSQRVVQEGKIVTAAGVSSGVDMGLTLAALLFGDQMAESVQLTIEYDPQPPFDSGSPGKATPEVIEMVKERSEKRLENFRAQAPTA